MKNFYGEHYAKHNDARLSHLASLGLPLERRTVLEVGSGPGHHTKFYLDRHCSVTATDARPECIEAIAAQYPFVRVAVVDMNKPDPLKTLGMFEVIHAYGVLYHLEDPEVALTAMASVCTDLLLLETCVSPSGREINLVPEVGEDFTQSSTGRGCRPGREWVFAKLQALFPFVYQTRTQPDHPEFPLNWSIVEPGNGLVRIVTVASRRPLNNDLLSSSLLEEHQRFESD